MQLHDRQRCASALFFLLLAVGLVAGCSSAQQGSDTRLPDYIKREAGGYVVNLEESSQGRAEFRPESHAVTYQGSNGEITFQYSAVSGTAGLSLRRTLDQLPINIAPTLTPGNGVADLFVAIGDSSSAETPALTLTVVMDEDWKGVIADEMFIGRAEFGPNFEPYDLRNGGRIRIPHSPEPGYPKMDVRPVEFNRGTQDWP
jgi:hypothetical protein